MALAKRRPKDVIHHSDQGSQYTSIAFGLRCREAGVRPSTGSVGDAYDNAMYESFFATLECELLARCRFRTQAEAVARMISEKFAIELSLASVGKLLAELGMTPQKPLTRAYERDPAAIEAWKQTAYPQLAKRAKRKGAEIYFWDESGFRADVVQGRTWAVKGRTPTLELPGTRQSVSAASAVNAKGGFWFVTYKGGMTAELFVSLLKHMMRGRRKPLYIVLDSLPAHKAKMVQDYVASTNGRLELHFLPGYAPELNPDEFVWNHVKRTGTAKSPLAKGDNLQDRIEADLLGVQANPRLVRSFFKAPSVAYITD